MRKQARFLHCEEGSNFAPSMKNTLLILTAACTLTGCAGVQVTKTDIATGATNPKAIYIRSYADEAKFVGHHSSPGERPIRHSLAPAEYSKALKEELEKMAPARVLEDNETPTIGWLVESNLEVVDAGNPDARHVLLPGVGRSEIVIHVRVTDVAGRHHGADVKDMGKGVGRGNVIYEFDLEGGSRLTGPIGSIYAPGWGYATPFDYKNAAERVLIALSVDPLRYGGRQSTTIR
jgi:hypothetical protein